MAASMTGLQVCREAAKRPPGGHLLAAAADSGRMRTGCGAAVGRCPFGLTYGMLGRMSPRTLGSATVATLIAVMTLAGGCATAPKDPDKPAQEFLGMHAVNVLADPDKIEGWNYNAPDGTSYSDPAAKPLDLSFAKELRAILYDGDTYAKRGHGSFSRSFGFRIHRGAQTIEVIVSLANDSILIKTMAPTGLPVTTSASAGGAHAKLANLAKRAFPGQDVR